MQKSPLEIQIPQDWEKIVQELQDVFVQKRQTFALAESCTGGLLAHLLTTGPGASQYFLGSFVTYSNELKQSVLSVKKETLERYGAVSQETVCEMLQGVFQITTADVAVAVSGIAGPTGGTLDKPIGTVFVAIGERKKQPPQVMRLFLSGSRNKILFSTAYKIFSLFLREK
ncbi:MAG: CinA family protein [Chlamydiae bacterium]|nr:CinA family protein [Chlamydiota bacterium]